MADLTPTFGMQKPNTSAFQVTVESAGDTVTNAALINGQPAGLLLTFLSASYANSAAAETAFRALGAWIVVRQISGTATTVLAATWEIQGGGGTPYLTISGGADQVLEIAIHCPHSIEQ